jgi:hypothetical protein
MMKHFKPYLSFLSVFSLLIAVAPESVFAQQKTGKEGEFADGPQVPEHITLTISARVIGKDSVDVWAQDDSQVTITGRPVGIKLSGENVAVFALFTPYFYQDGSGYIVAQGQIWLEIPGQGISYWTAVQTIPVTFGEQIYFYPLGNEENSEDDRLEILIAVNKYNDASGAQSEEQKSVPSETIPNQPPDDAG